jgi:ATP-dependent Clp protease ATP-binding subunit ClpX
MFEDKFIGQEKVIEAIVSNIYTNQKIIDLNDKTLLELNKTSILLDGSTGTGKTAIIKDIADNIGVPIIITNPSNYSSTGYVGASLSDILVELLKKANGDLKLAERGIVCFDEIDKLGGYDKSRRLEMKSAIQRELLTLIGGTIYEINYNDSKINFDTSKITFFGLGAFTDIRDIKMNKNSTKKIGFNNDTEEENTYVITEQDYIDYGLERELMGRFKVILYTKDYSINDYKNILLNSSISPLKGFIDTIKLLSDNTIEVTYSDDFVDAVAFSAYNDKFGARGVQKIMSTLKSYFLKRILCKEIQKINLTADLLNELKEMSIRKF